MAVSCRKEDIMSLLLWHAMHYPWRRPEGEQEESRRRHGGRGRIMW
jgi:hypothetical protein